MVMDGLIREAYLPRSLHMAITDSPNSKEAYLHDVRSWESSVEADTTNSSIIAVSFALIARDTNLHISPWF